MATVESCHIAMNRFAGAVPFLIDLKSKPQVARLEPVALCLAVDLL